ncbi:hypothetical protein I350_06965 [Cryptococcus amylolentus CBS 6273]|uniref:Uncharacterized protein n=1 Tax=Cryptococcus amylolentus CBS 6273 TaxID=1296118 RepID=A0A1E3JK65_9TREE|nr:hypothetical protein I350_06965 [Cryptococcus amylolentus CBS 6273]
MPRVDLPLDIQQGLDPLFLQALQSFGDSSGDEGDDLLDPTGLDLPPLPDHISIPDSSSEDEGDDLLDPTGLDLPPLDHISIPDSGSEGDSSHKSSGGLSPHASRDGGDDDFSSPWEPVVKMRLEPKLLIWRVI